MENNIIIKNFFNIYMKEEIEKMRRGESVPPYPSLKKRRNNDIDDENPPRKRRTREDDHPSLTARERNQR
jgi:hypothetical protein